MERPILRYFGGKFMLAPWIVANMPDHRVYVEPFGGAASVLMRKPRSYAEVYNDLDDDIVNLFRLLRDPPAAVFLEMMLRNTPYSREEFELSTEACSQDMERARRLIVRSFMGFGADSVCNPERSTGFRANSNRSGSTPAHDWVNYPDAIEAFSARLRGVVIENRPAWEVIKAHDGPDTLFYLDPPYMEGTRTRRGVYKFEMSDEEHVDMLTSLHGLKGMVMLSGYDSRLYKDLGWRYIEKKAWADGAKERRELLWFNKAAEKGISQPGLFEVADADSPRK
jgi:DNA adenine methylase